METKRPTIIDVARAAGTSKSVVSRVITGKGSVSEQMRRKVTQTIEALGYQANHAGRSLKTGRSGTVGLLLRYVPSDYYSSLFMNLQNIAAKEGVHIVAATGNMAPGSEVPALESLMNLGVDALIVGSGRLPDLAINKIAEHIPTVVVSRPAAGTRASSVHDDPDEHARLCVGKLWEHGHRSISLFEHPDTFSSPPRVNAIRREAVELGLRVRTHASNFNMESGYEGAREWLGERDGDSALVFLNFDAAAGAILALEEAGLSVPGDVSVIAADVYHFPRPSFPRISGSSRDAQEFATAVWDEVMAQLSPEEEDDEAASSAREIRVPVYWVEGETLADAPTASR